MKNHTFVFFFYEIANVSSVDVVLKFHRTSEQLTSSSAIILAINMQFRISKYDFIQKV